MARTFLLTTALLLLTAHDAFRDPELYARVGLVVDTRNALADMKGSWRRVKA